MNYTDWNGIFMYLQNEPYLSKYRPTSKGGEKRVNNLMKQFLLSISITPANKGKYEKVNNARKVQKNFTKFTQYLKKH